MYGTYLPSSDIMSQKPTQKLPYIRFNMQEAIDDLVAEGYSRSLAILVAKRRNKKRQKQVLADIKAKNDRLMDRSILTPKMFN